METLRKFMVGYYVFKYDVEISGEYFAFDEKEAIKHFENEHFPDGGIESVIHKIQVKEIDEF